jgi:hypothetical protein
MKSVLILAAMSGLAFAADVPPADKTPKATDADKLKIREAQLARVQLAGQMAGLESQWKELAVGFQTAQARETKAIEDLGKKLGCDVNPETIECKPKAPAAPAAKK